MLMSDVSWVDVREEDVRCSLSLYVCTDIALKPAFFPASFCPLYTSFPERLRSKLSCFDEDLFSCPNFLHMFLPLSFRQVYVQPE